MFRQKVSIIVLPILVLLYVHTKLQKVTFRCVKQEIPIVRIAI